jgi:cytochrome c
MSLYGFRTVIAFTQVLAGCLLAGAALAESLPRPAAFAPCATCHVIQPGKKSTIGPNLFGVSQRSSGALAEFSYSPAMKSAGIEWNPKNLEAFIASPREQVPGTKMAFPGVKDAAKLKEIVDYLLSLQ